MQVEQETQNPELSDQLHAVNRRLRRGWITQLAPFELSPHQYRALAALVRSTQHGHSAAAQHHEGMRLNELADRLRIAPRSVTEVIDLLEDKELVRRGPDPADRRASRITVTDQGQQLYLRVRGERLQQAEGFFSALGAEDRAELSRLLGLLLDANPRQEQQCATPAHNR